jgi:hypothetical protein
MTSVCSYIIGEKKSLKKKKLIQILNDGAFPPSVILTIWAAQNMQSF